MAKPADQGVYYEKQLAMFEATLGLLSEGNQLSALTISRIAAKAGIGKGTVYEYFESKEALFSALILYCMETELADATADIAASTGFEGAVLAVFHFVHARMTNPLSSFRLVMANSPLFSGCPAKASDACARTDYFARSRALTLAIFQRGRDEGVVGPSLDDTQCELALKSAVAAYVMPGPPAMSPAERQSRALTLLRKMLA